MIHHSEWSKHYSVLPAELSRDEMKEEESVLVKPPIYGLDILVEESETNNHQDKPRSAESKHSGNIHVLDPRTSVIQAAGISTVDGDEYYDGDERRILSMLDQRFAVLEPGIVSTWNGSILDLPFLNARARALRLNLGLRLQRDPRKSPGGKIAERRQPQLRIGGSRLAINQPVCGAWHNQRHLDLRWVYRQQESSSTTDELLGLDPRRGAHLARSLAERRWSKARRHLDRVPPPRRLNSYTWTCMAAGSEAGPTVKISTPASGRLLGVPAGGR